MKIHIQELEKSPVYIDTFRPAHLLKDKNLLFEIQNGIYLSMNLRKDKKNILAKGRMTGVVILECSRCLEHYPHSIEMDIEVRFLPRKNLTGKGLFDLADPDLNVSYYDHDIIDIDDHIRENLLLSIPIKPLCKKSCQGLCQWCGKNLNDEKCNHRKEADIDPRLELLKKMLEE